MKKIVMFVLVFLMLVSVSANQYSGKFAFLNPDSDDARESIVILRDLIKQGKLFSLVEQNLDEQQAFTRDDITDVLDISCEITFVNNKFKGEITCEVIHKKEDKVYYLEGYISGYVRGNDEIINQLSHEVFTKLKNYLKTRFMLSGLKNELVQHVENLTKEKVDLEDRIKKGDEKRPGRINVWRDQISQIESLIRSLKNSLENISEIEQLDQTIQQRLMLETIAISGIIGRKWPETKKEYFSNIDEMTKIFGSKETFENNMKDYDLLNEIMKQVKGGP